MHSLLQFFLLLLLLWWALHTQSSIHFIQCDCAYIEVNRVSVLYVSPAPVTCVCILETSAPNLRCENVRTRLVFKWSMNIKFLRIVGNRRPRHSKTKSAAQWKVNGGYYLIVSLLLLSTLLLLCFQCTSYSSFTGKNEILKTMQQPQQQQRTSENMPFISCDSLTFRSHVDVVRWLSFANTFW